MHTSIVVRALNEAEHLPKFFDGLVRQSVQPDEIVLVDSGSTDATVHIAESYGASIVHIPPGDFTFGGSLNSGIDRSKGDIIVMASAHVYPIDDFWLERLLAPFADPGVGLTYGGQDGEERSNFAEVQLLQDWFPLESNLDQKDPFCNNANCAVRREIWEAHPYDEQLTGLEDIALGRKLLAAGHKIAYVGDARVAHVHSERFRQTLNRYRREAIAYSEIFGRGDLDLRRSSRLFVHNLATDLKAARERSMLISTALPCVRFRFAQFAGAYLGHRAHTGEGTEVVRRMYYPRPK